MKNINDVVEEVNKFRIFNKLKKVYRFNSVDNRKESSAEHSWSCLLLADFFISKFNYNLDKLKVYELLMYHDIVEIEVGDSPLHPSIKKVDKSEKEKEAIKKLYENFPSVLKDKILDLFLEFEEQKTLEAKFAKAIDAFDAVIHEIDYKEDWKGWTEEFLLSKKIKFFEDFPELKKAFIDLLSYLKKEGYFDQ